MKRNPICLALAVVLAPTAGMAVTRGAPLGPPIAVSGDEHARSPSLSACRSVDMDASGNFAVAWVTYDQSRVLARRYHANGTASGPDIVVDVSAFTTDCPAVAMDADGDFVIAWNSHASPLDPDGGINARVFDRQGNALGPEFLVNVDTERRQGEPAVEMAADGDFVVAWNSYISYLVREDIRARRFRNDGTPRGGEIAVNTQRIGAQFGPDIALDADGDFMVVWSDAGYNPLQTSGRAFTADGVPVSEVFHIGETETQDRWNPAVGAAPSGGFVVVTSGRVLDHDGVLRGNVMARRYSGAGQPLGTEFRVSEPRTFGQEFADVSVAADGGFTIAWIGAEGFTNRYGVFARSFRANGTARSAAFDVGAPAFRGYSPGIAVDADGDFAVTWISGEFNSTAFSAQRFVGPANVDLRAETDAVASPLAAASPFPLNIEVHNDTVAPAPSGDPAIDAWAGAAGAAAAVSVEVALEGGALVSVESPGWFCEDLTCQRLEPLQAGTVDALALVVAAPGYEGEFALQAVATSVSFDPDESDARQEQAIVVECTSASRGVLAFAPMAAVDEGTTARIGIVRRDGICGAASVDYSTSAGGTATPGQDFTTGADTLSWGNGDGSRRNFDLVTLDDALDEADESALLVLTGAHGAALGARSSARQVIVDNDGAPQAYISSAPGRLVEGQSRFLEISLNASSARRVRVAVVVSGGNAAAGADFTLQRETLAFEPGDVVQRVRLTALADALTEGIERVDFSLGELINAQPGVPTSATVRIADD